MITWQGKIAEFIMFKACRMSRIYEMLIHEKGTIIVHLPNLASLKHAIERRAFFIHERIGREMLHTERESLTDISLTLIKRLVWKSKHEVDTDIAKTCFLSIAHCLNGLG